MNQDKTPTKAEASLAVNDLISRIDARGLPNLLKADESAKVLRSFIEAQPEAVGEIIDYEALARAHGWREAPAYGGWINDDYRDNDPEVSNGYEVHETAADVCAICDLRPSPPQAVTVPAEDEISIRRTLQLRAWAAVKLAISKGQLVRPKVCEKCGKEPPPAKGGRSRIHAHHSDYSRPLDVEWVCAQCHRDVTPLPPPRPFRLGSAGENNGGAKLTAAVIEEMKKRNKEGDSFRQLAREYGVDRVTVRRAIKGESYKYYSSLPTEPAPRYITISHEDAVYALRALKESFTLSANSKHEEAFERIGAAMKKPSPAPQQELSSSQVSQAADAELIWPSGCYKPSSCSRHRRCMYTKCVHESADITALVDAVAPQQEGE